MSLDATVLKLIEEAISGCEHYHEGLDKLLLRSGVTDKILAEARCRADIRARDSGSSFERAPKRYVAQEVVSALEGRGSEGDKIFTSLIDSLKRGHFPDADSNALDAIKLLGERVDSDREEKKRQREEREDEENRRSRKAEKAKEQRRLERDQKRDELRRRFEALRLEKNLQSRGYEFESFLNELFEFEGLRPHKPFRNVGEQIDGSFSWNGRTHLLEAKWVSHKCSCGELSPLMYKIEGKTADTRGLFVAVNGFSDQALSSLRGKGALRFVCLDGGHLMRTLVGHYSFEKLMETVWRHADETGDAYLPVGNGRGL